MESRNTVSTFISCNKPRNLPHLLTICQLTALRISYVFVMSVDECGNMSTNIPDIIFRAMLDKRAWKWLIWYRWLLVPDMLPKITIFIFYITMHVNVWWELLVNTLSIFINSCYVTLRETAFVQVMHDSYYTGSKTSREVMLMQLHCLHAYCLLSTWPMYIKPGILETIALRICTLPWFSSRITSNLMPQHTMYPWIPSVWQSPGRLKT